MSAVEVTADNLSVEIVALVADVIVAPEPETVNIVRAPDVPTVFVPASVTPLPETTPTVTVLNAPATPLAVVTFVELAAVFERPSETSGAIEFA
jgi:hypothetical protein